MNRAEKKRAQPKQATINIAQQASVLQARTRLETRISESVTYSKDGQYYHLLLQWTTMHLLKSSQSSLMYNK